MLTSERAWAHAMSMKSARAADTSKQGVTGSTRTHVISRLEKARKNAAYLQNLLKPSSKSGQLQLDYLEATAYALMLLGTLKLEAQKWNDCLVAYSQVHLIYTTLATSQPANYSENYRHLLSNYVEPSIRYATYQSKLPRTLSIASIASRYVPKDADFISHLPARAPSAADDEDSEKGDVQSETAGELPSSITWRSRSVKLQDARIAQSIANVSAAERILKSLLSSTKDLSSRDRAAAYDDVLNPSQDAVDATRDAISEMSAEGVPLGDPRMQALYVTRTAVNYAMIGWRIGRNRVLCSHKDGSSLEGDDAGKMKRSKKGAAGKKPVTESRGAMMKRLKERVVLYDSTLQSLESIKELEGVAADEDLNNEIDTKLAYFSALR